MAHDPDRNRGVLALSANHNLAVNCDELQVGGFIAELILIPFIRRQKPGYRTYYGDEGVLGFDARGCDDELSLP